MGTPDFAVPTLRALYPSQQIVGVYTQPDRPAGRGRHLAISAVKAEAIRYNLPVFQPKSLRPATAVDELRAVEPELIVVAAYGLILPQGVLDIPIHGCLNVHASLLPKYRGASPIASAILAGESETGITIMLMDAGLDTGPMLSQRAIPIADGDTTGTLEQKLSVVGAELLMETLPRWIGGEITPQPQDESRATLTRLIRKEDGLIDWSSSAYDIVRRLRAFDPWPGTFTVWRRQPLKILRAVAQPFGAPMACAFKRNGSILVGAGEGSVELRAVQLAGKRAMTIAEFVRGHPHFIGAQLGGSA